MTNKGLVCVVGAGISGLAAAQELMDLGENVLVLEAADYAGGTIRTSRKDGLLFENGPNSFPSTAKDVIELAKKAHVHDNMICAETCSETRLIYHQQVLKKVPTGPKALLKSDLFTIWQKLRIFSEPFIGKKKSSAPESVAEFFFRRFGAAPTRTLVDAFVSGIYAGDARQVGIKSTFPKLVEMEEEYGSVFKAMKARRKDGTRPKMTIQNFKNGLQELPQGLAKNLGDRLRLNTKTKRLEESQKGGYLLHVEGPHGNEEIHAKKVVLAVPAPVAGLLLTSVTPIVADLLFDIDYAPIATVHAAFAQDEICSIPQAFGFLAPRPSRMRTLGWLFTSQTFLGRAPQGFHTLNGYIGGASDPLAVDAEEDALRYILLGELSVALGMRQFPKPAYFDIINHVPGIPQYIIGHSQRVTAVNKLLRSCPNLALIGNYLDGVSLNDCVKRGVEAARELSEQSENLVREDVA